MTQYMVFYLFFNYSRCCAEAFLVILYCIKKCENWNLGHSELSIIATKLHTISKSHRYVSNSGAFDFNLLFA